MDAFSNWAHYLPKYSGATGRDILPPLAVGTPMITVLFALWGQISISILSWVRASNCNTTINDFSELGREVYYSVIVLYEKHNIALFINSALWSLCTMLSLIYTFVDMHKNFIKDDIDADGMSL